ncbi:MAG: hypothetical protein IT371_26015 [Deltaproteobacteria bacterium]|nr:hypothetical protein [Deltaproteobacteria bacterium]
MRDLRFASTTLVGASLCALVLAACGPVGSGTEELERTAMGTGATIDKSAPSRLIVIGAHIDQGSQFVTSAAERAARLRAVYPGDQVVVYVASSTLKTYGDVVQGVGFHDPAKATPESLGLLATVKAADGSYPRIVREWLIPEVASYRRLRSIDIFSHSSATLGPRLEGSSTLFSTADVAAGYASVESWRASFSDGAFVFFWGCNAGFQVAPALAKLWHIPVAGALNGTNFQMLLERKGVQRFFDAFARPSGTEWTTAKQNAISGEVPRACPRGGCRRMKPNRGTKYQTAAPIYKFFCDAEARLEQRCERAMLGSLLAAPSVQPVSVAPSYADFQAVAIDFLCPNGFFGRLDGEQACGELIRRFEADPRVREELPLLKPQPFCTDEGCQVTVKCAAPTEGRYCDFTVVVTPEQKKLVPTNTVDEFERYRRGYCAAYPEAERCQSLGKPTPPL